MGTLHHELVRFIARQQAKGITSAWVAPDTWKALSQLMATSSLAPQLKQPAPAVATVAPAAPAPPAPQAVKPAPPPPAPPPVSLTPLPNLATMDWEELRKTADSCQACHLGATRTHLVFEDGARQARVMFIGEGPGEDEDLQGVPFVGRAGQLLTRMILAMGLDRSSSDPAKAAYIANIVKCRPPRNRNPLDDEGGVCLNYLKRQIDLVKPEVIVLLGAVPLKFLLGKVGITKARGQWLDYQGIPVMPTFHPAYLLRFEGFRDKFVAEKRKVWADLQLVMAKLGLPLPQ